MGRIVIGFIGLIVVAAPHVVRAEALGYVDMGKVNSEASEPKRLLATVNAEIPDIKRAMEAASKPDVKPDVAKATRERVEAHNRRAEQVDKSLHDHLAPVLAKLKAERHLTDILPILPLTPTKADLTEEVIRRWNAADAEGTAAELAKTRSELEALKAKASAKSTTGAGGKQ